MSEPSDLRWLLLIATALHVFWGAALIFGGTLHTTGLDEIVSLGWGAPEAGTWMIGISVLALWGLLLLKYNPVLSAAMGLPQQTLLMLSSWGAAQAIYYSRFADGVIRSRWFIAADQLPLLTLVVLHSVIFICIYAGPLHRQLRGR